MSAQPSGQPLLLLIDPAARAVDGESVRVAKDVLCAGASVKVAIPESPGELARALEHRGRRRPVVVGGDRALHRVVQVLYQRRELAAPVSLIPVGPAADISLALRLGLPTHPVPAARAALSGAERRLDLLVDDRGGVVLGGVEISGTCGETADRGRGRAGRGSIGRGQVGGWANGTATGGPHPRWGAVAQSARRSLVRGLKVPLMGRSGERLPKLRVEADGVVLVDLHHPVELVTLSSTWAANGFGDSQGRHQDASGAHGAEEARGDGRPGDGPVQVLISRPAAAAPLRVSAHTVTVSGRGFRYAADAEPSGPVRTRTWTARPGALRLTVPG